MMRILPPAGLAALLILPACSGDDSTDAFALDIHTVTRGDLRISVREQGEIQAAENTRVASQLEGRATLIYLIPEGSVVAQGDKLAELDVSGIEDKLANQGISVAKAAAALDQAKKNFEIMENTLEAARSAAESRLKIAQMRLEKFIGQAVNAEVPRVGASIAGTNREMVQKLRELLDDEFAVNPAAEVNYSDLVNQVMNLMGEDAVLLEMGEMANLILRQIDEIALARADLELAADKLYYSQMLFEKLFITKNERDSDEINWKRQLSRVTLAWNDLELLIKFTLQETKITLEQDVHNAVLDLASVKASNEAQRVREQAELISKDAENDLASERLDNYREQIDNAVIYAPTPGLVVYATEGGGRGRQPVEEGVEIRERQAIINLPNVTRMTALLKVHEAQIDQVANGQRANIKIDAFPERNFLGAVSHVSALPDSGSRFTNNDLKVYKTTVSLDGENADQALRPGMNATVEILVGVVPEVINVPLPAIQHQGAVAYAWKVTPAGPEPVTVKIGNNNLSHVEVVEGLQEGDRIYLGTPPDVEIPEFEQPEDAFSVEDAVSLEPGGTAQAEMRMDDGNGNDGGLRGGRGGGNRRGGADTTALRNFLAGELPDYAESLQEARGFFSLVRDPDFQSAADNAVQSNPDLRDQWQAYKERMSGRGDRGGRGGERTGRERTGRTGRGGGGRSGR